MIKKILLSIIAVLILIGIAIFIYRYQIIQYSAETVIRKYLPDYVKIDRIGFDFEGKKIVLKGLTVISPPDFSYSHILEIQELGFEYRMNGKNFTDGVEVFGGYVKNPVLTIERRSDGRVNIIEMQKSIEAKGARDAGAQTSKNISGNQAEGRMIGGKKISDILKIPQSIPVKNGKLIFIDMLAAAKPNTVTLENIEADIGLKFDDSYIKVLRLSSSGRGNINGNSDEVMGWNISLDATAPRLTMSNRFEASNVEMVRFQPYYDKYSPFIFKSGRFSGTLIFDFDNGNIGSTNEIRLSDLRFMIKPGYENALFWETTVPDLVKYFSSASGDIIFDFKIKGDMSDPKFYLGPISKQALTSMAIDKVSAAIESMSKSADASAPQGAPKSDVEKAKEYIDMFKGLIKK